MVSHPETGSDSPIGSDLDWGRDNSSRPKISPKPVLKSVPNSALNSL